MSLDEITAEALRRGLITTNGKTPAQTMAAALLDEARSRGLSEEGNDR